MTKIRFGRATHTQAEAWAEIKKYYPEVTGWRARHDKHWWVWELPEPAKRKRK